MRYKISVKTYKEKKRQIPCYAGKLRAVLDQVGNLYPCETMMFEEEKRKFGNLRNCNYDFKKVWFSEKAKVIRNEIVRGRCFCTHECDLTVNILFNLRLWPTLVKKWWMRKLNDE